MNQTSNSAAGRKLALRQACERYLSDARAHEREGRIDAAWACLEAAHILGQRSTRLHVASHAAMLGLAWRTQHSRELAGQIARLLAAAAATWAWVPAGNSGRAHVSAFAPAPIPEDLATLIAAGDASDP